MRCRHFTLRLTAQHARDDEARLNEFLQAVAVQSVQTTTGAPGCWSVLVFYDDIAPTAGLQRVSAGPAKATTSPSHAPELQRAPAGAAQTTAAPSPTPELTADEQRIYERLREWRSQRASAEGKPPYVIANNAVLMQIARRHMTITAAEDLLAISQFGPARAARYGPDILQLLAGLPANDEPPLFDEER